MCTLTLTFKVKLNLKKKKKLLCYGKCIHSCFFIQMFVLIHSKFGPVRSSMLTELSQFWLLIVLMGYLSSWVVIPLIPTGWWSSPCCVLSYESQSGSWSHVQQKKENNIWLAWMLMSSSWLSECDYKYIFENVRIVLYVSVTITKCDTVKPASAGRCKPMEKPPLQFHIL